MGRGPGPGNAARGATVRAVYAARPMAMPVHGGLAELPAVRRLIELAIDEDLGRGDVTSRAVFGPPAPDSPRVVADVIAREPLIAFGIEIAAAVFAMVDPRIAIERGSFDGASVGHGARLLTVRGAAESVLAAERTALNFVQRLSGVATLASRYAAAVAGTRARVVDTRKTTPGFRVLEKAAVAAGGCGNHRFDLGSGILIKDNHIAACGSVHAAVEAAIARAPHPLRIEVEVEDLDQLDEALAAGAEVVLLDNMSPAEVAVAAARAHGHDVIVEVSGRITLATVADYARAGADRISVGALTHSAPSADIALDVRA